MICLSSRGMEKCSCFYRIYLKIEELMKQMGDKNTKKTMKTMKIMVIMVIIALLWILLVLLLSITPLLLVYPIYPINSIRSRCLVEAVGSWIRNKSNTNNSWCGPYRSWWPNPSCLTHNTAIIVIITGIVGHVAPIARERDCVPCTLCIPVITPLSVGYDHNWIICT